MKQKKENRQYKDRLFRLVFGTKEALLELYNAINGTCHENPEELEITTLENVIYMNLKNDVSFLVLEVLNLYEHQSTFNPNMPARGLLYFAPLYRKYIEEHALNLYSGQPVALPMPQYVVFYNGLKEEPDRSELKLTDLFIRNSSAIPCMEVTALMLNINLGHNRELMERCLKLKEYSIFIAEIRNRLRQGVTLDAAADGAIDYCIQEGILAEVLRRHRAEVRNVIFEEYDQEAHMKMERRDWREIGRKEGKTEDIVELLSELGEVPEPLCGTIMEQSNLTVLGKWLKLAAKAQSVKEFEERMQKAADDAAAEEKAAYMRRIGKKA